MKIIINEYHPDTEIIINCPQVTGDILKIVSMLRSFDKKVSGTKDGQTHIIDINDVFYFDSVDKRSFIYTANDVFHTPLKLYEIEERLSDIGFFRCSKSQIVNIKKILSLCPDFGGRVEITMLNGEKLIISRQYTKSFKERLGLK